jgi:integrase
VGTVGVETLAEARQKAREYFRDVGAGVDPRKPKKEAGGATLVATLDAYLKANNLKPRSAAGLVDEANRYLRDWMDKPLASITREMVEEKHRSIAADIARRHAKKAMADQLNHLQRAERAEVRYPEAAEAHRAKAAAAKRRAPYSGHATANRALKIVRALYNFAKDRDDSLPPNPVRLKKQWNKIAPRTRHLVPSDLPAFHKAVTELPSEIARDYILLMLFTGLRRREAASLRWSDVDLKNRTLTISDTKAGRPLKLPLTRQVHALLSARRAIGKREYVFLADSASGHIESPKFHFAQIRAACGIYVSAHDLRRTFCTIAESVDIPAYALKALVNHSLGSGDVTAGYIQMSAERLRAPAQRVSDEIERLRNVTAMAMAMSA